MGNIDYVAVVLGAAAFFAVGALWYTALFGQAWRAEMGITPERVAEMRARGGAAMATPMLVSIVAELMVSWMLGHQIARTQPAPHVIMMFAFGFGTFLMCPAIAINYAYQGRSLKLFAIDAGHFIVGTAAMGAVHLALR